MVAVTADAHISEAFKKMIDHQVLSLPVYDKSRGRYTEFIDTIDILVHVLNAFPKGAVDPNLDFEAFMKEPVSSLTDLSSRNPYKYA
jgi:CBS domain-containing protein